MQKDFLLYLILLFCLTLINAQSKQNYLFIKLVSVPTIPCIYETLNGKELALHAKLTIHQICGMKYYTNF